MITITPFNMKEELEEGHFDAQGHYQWKKQKEIKDSWLDNIDWVKVKGRPEDKYKVHKDDDNKGLGDDSSSEDEQIDEKFDLIENYKEILAYMKPKETIAKALQRLALWRSIEGQHFEDPSKTYQPFQLDSINRGSFNMSDCLTDLINCWELVRGDVVCWHDKYFETVCGLSREYCQDVTGDFDTYLTWYEYTLFEAVCQNRWHENYT